MAYEPLKITVAYEHRVLATCLGQAIVNVFHTRITAFSGVENPLNDNIHSLNLEVQKKWRTFLPFLPVQYQVIEYQVKEVRGSIDNPNHPNEPPYLIDYGAEDVIEGVVVADAGTLVGDVDHTFSAIGLQKKTGKSGRSYRGAMRLGPLTIDQAEENVIDPTVRTNLTTQALWMYGENAPAAPMVFKWRVGLLRKTSMIKKKGVAIVPGDIEDLTNVLVKRLVSSQVSRKQVKRIGA